jgi:hypothetical protein
MVPIVTLCNETARWRREEFLSKGNDEMLGED